ncbi:4-hydroxy-2-oxoheptanedioate aldolase [Azospirillum fermentarium]|uniref:HpcH/HpaI aldolase family protein n=1 Tax=Azospirillum fermentarium TaxID=1233114 RepID=UPI002226B861|nr:aldolase/citrate lyase family protein [Azospirillum fermentarium]MCW2248759.1 4-hydroxy-2-oxoheptanedioate aldolase [Azospirillum fermentarium]
MFRENRLKRTLAAGRPALGCWLDMASPVAAEIIGLAGYDFVVIDHEHGPGTLADGQHLLQALSGTAATAVMRVPSNDPVYLKRALDLGVEGIMVPSVNSADEARAVVAACRYPPAGIRGAAYGMARGADYGLAGTRYRDTAADELFIICQIETADAVAAVPDIAAVPGVDCLFIGPYDLSGSIGRLGRFDEPEVAVLLDRAERAILNTGTVYGTIPVPGRPMETLLERGCRLVVAGGDIGFVRQGAVAQVEAFRRAVEER